MKRKERRLMAKLTGKPMQQSYGSARPFKRINALITRANEANESGDDRVKDAAISALRAYVSHGHGKAGVKARTITGLWNRERSKYDHKQCCAEGKR